jgi:hypothetical protein
MFSGGTLNDTGRTSGYLSGRGLQQVLQRVRDVILGPKLSREDLILTTDASRLDIVGVGGAPPGVYGLNTVDGGRPPPIRSINDRSTTEDLWKNAA